MSDEFPKSSEQYNEPPYRGIVKIAGYENNAAMGSNIKGDKLTLEEPIIDKNLPGEYPIDIIYIRTEKNIFALRPKPDGGWEYKNSTTGEVKTLGNLYHWSAEYPNVHGSDEVVIGQKLRLTTAYPHLQEEDTGDVLEYVAINDKKKNTLRPNDIVRAAGNNQTNIVEDFRVMLKK